MADNIIVKDYKPTRFSFGSTSAIITNLAIVTGLNSTVNARISIIGSLLIIALADNISDALGIHIYQESVGLKQRSVWLSTFTNFFSRFLVSTGFIMIVYFLPLNLAIILSIVYGLFIMSLVTYMIAKSKKINPLSSIVEHLIIAVSVITLSKLIGSSIISRFK